jgi:hypothetical protein
MSVRQLPLIRSGPTNVGNVSVCRPGEVVAELRRQNQLSFLFDNDGVFVANGQQPGARASHEAWSHSAAPPTNSGLAFKPDEVNALDGITLLETVRRARRHGRP